MQWQINFSIVIYLYQLIYEELGLSILVCMAQAFTAIQFYVLKFTSVQATGVKKFIFSPKAFESRRQVLLCTSRFGIRCVLDA